MENLPTRRHEAQTGTSVSKVSEPSTYSPRSATNRKRWGGRTIQERRNQRVRQEYAKLHRGMLGQECWFFTLTCGRRLDPAIRKDVWHVLRTRLKQQWPEMQAWTVVEWGKRRGVHLHAVVKGTPGLTEEWLQHVVELLHDETAIHIGDACLHSTDQLARYLTKQHADPRQAMGWPRGFHPFSATRGWCPDWLSRQEWFARQRDR